MSKTKLQRFLYFFFAPKNIPSTLVAFFLFASIISVIILAEQQRRYVDKLGYKNKNFDIKIKCPGIPTYSWLKDAQVDTVVDTTFIFRKIK